MNTPINILKIALFISAIFLFNSMLFCQKNTLELLPGSEKFEFNESTGIHRLIGSVNFIYQGNTMYCDSAHYKEKSQEVRAYGNVHITKNDINLFCDSLFYQGSTKKAKLWGNVRVRDHEYKIETDTLEYDANRAIGTYRYGGKVESILNKEILSSKVGYMYSETKNMFFSGMVNYRKPELLMTTDTLRFNYKNKIAFFCGPTDIFQFEKNKKNNSKIHCESGWFNTETYETTLQKNASIYRNNQLIKGDNLYSNPPKGVSTAKGNVIFKDSIQKTEFKGNYLYSSEVKKISYLTGKAIAYKISGKDTLFIHADTLYNLKDSSGKSSIIKGFYNVKIFRNDIQAKCDSIFYDQSKEKMELYKDPIVWVKAITELKGDYLELFFQSDTLVEKAIIKGNSTILFELDSGKYYNQIGGNDIISYFKNNEIYKSDVLGNACTIAFPENSEKKDSTLYIKRLGMNRIFSSNLKVVITKNEIQSVTYIEKPDGIFYPMNKLKKEDSFIKGFKWEAAIRPKKWSEILD